jgi:release factor glutamine methyltransferase
MGNEKIFGPKDAEQEIERFERTAKYVVWRTPQAREIQLLIPPTVYPPREDTDLMAQTIANLPNSGGKRLLEIGCGSGAVSIFAAQLGFEVTACDINPFAVAATRNAAASNGVVIEANEGGPGPNTDGSVEQWAGREPFDVIVWNLPYLTHEEDTPLLGPLEEAALLDTDQKGLVARLMGHLKSNSLLKMDGVAFLLVSQNEKGGRARTVCLANGFAVRTVASDIFEDGERLEVLGVWKPYVAAESNYVESIDSTNTALLKSTAGIGTMLQAGRQISGHGRRGRPWIHEEQAFAASWVIDEIRGIPNPNQLQLRAGLALYEAVVAMDTPPECIALKWPNDVLLHIVDQTRKVGGILVESSSRGKNTRVVLGIGCNMSSSNPHKENFSLAALDELSEHASTEKFTPIIHAAVASWFEQKNGISPVKTSEVNALFESTFSRSIQLLGAPIYRKKKMAFEALKMDGNIVLVDEKKRTFSIDDGEDIQWTKCTRN